MHKVTGDLIEKCTAGFIVHGCNCQGAMGSGIAKIIRDKWPLVYTQYDRYHRTEGLKLGTVQPVNIDGDLVIVNAMTQEFYAGHPTCPHRNRHIDYEAVAKCFEAINGLPAVFPDVTPVVSFPLIGAGLARGNWNIIETIIKETITDMETVLWTLPE